MSLEQIEAYIREYPTPHRHDGISPPITLAFLDEPVRLTFDPAEIGREVVVVAVRNLIALPAATRTLVEPALYAFYCKEMADGAGNFDTPQEQLDWEAGFAKVPRFINPRHATSPEAVWPLVRFFSLRAYPYRNRAAVVSLWGEAAWDGEHGVALHFDEAARFLGVSDLNSGPQ